MRQKSRAQFLQAVAEAARRPKPKPRGRPAPQNMTDEGRQRGLEAIRNAPRCRTIRRNGEQCRCPAMKGSTRCLKHGGRVEVPAHPHNVKRFFAGTLGTQGEEERRSREAWEEMSHREQRDFLAMLPEDIREQPKLVANAASHWKHMDRDDFRAWKRLLEDLRARMMPSE